MPGDSKLLNLKFIISAPEDKSAATCCYMIQVFLCMYTLKIDNLQIEPTNI